MLGLPPSDGANAEIQALDVNGPEAKLTEGKPLSTNASKRSRSASSSDTHSLAAAILNDALGFLPAASVVFDFCDSVIAELPRLEFELTSDVLQTWLDTRLASGAEVAREAAGSEHF